MLRLNLNYFLQVWLVEVFPRIRQNILRLLLQNFEQKHRNHILQFRVLPEVQFVINPILNFLVIKEPNLSGS